MDLDLRTVVVLTALGSLLMGLVMLLAARSYPGHADGMRSWAWACGAQALAWALIGARGRAPDLLSIVVGNTAFVLAGAWYYRAVKEFRGEPFRRRVPDLVVAATFVAFPVFTYLVPSVAARLVIVSAAVAGLTAASGYALLRDAAGEPLSRWMTGLGFAVTGVAVVARAAYLLAVDPSLAAGLSPDPVQTAGFVANYAAVVLMTFGFVLMRSDRFNAELIRLATLDALTGCLNRAAIETVVRAEAARAARHGSPLSLLMLDLDRFKSINDAHGHPAGDAALKAVADELRRQLRVSDAVGRYGGEEFAVVLPNTAAGQAAVVAERIRSAVERATPDGMAGRLTVSIGVAGLASGDDHESLIRRADAALYEAKRRGRNRVVAAQAPEAGGAPVPRG